MIIVSVLLRLVLLQNDNKKSEIQKLVARWWSLSTESSTDICVTLVNLLLEVSIVFQTFNMLKMILFFKVSGYPKDTINKKTVTVENYMEHLESSLQHYDQVMLLLRFA
jgi:hypothetical protein